MPRRSYTVPGIKPNCIEDKSPAHYTVSPSLQIHFLLILLFTIACAGHCDLIIHFMNCAFWKVYVLNFHKIQFIIFLLWAMFFILFSKLNPVRKTFFYIFLFVMYIIFSMQLSFLLITLFPFFFTYTGYM